MTLVRRPLDWERWFAWRPVRVRERNTVWLQWVARRYVRSSVGNSWEYGSVD